MTYARGFIVTPRPAGTARGRIRVRGGTHAATAEALESAATLLGRRWKIGILYLLSRQPYRYNAIMRELPGATPKMVTQQLRALEADGLVVRHEYASAAKHTEYALTPMGEQFAPVVEALHDWVSRHWRTSPRPHGDLEGASGDSVAIEGHVSRRVP